MGGLIVFFFDGSHNIIYCSPCENKFQPLITAALPQ